jgi:hypothetical protein
MHIIFQDYVMTGCREAECVKGPNVRLKWQLGICMSIFSVRIEGLRSTDGICFVSGDKSTSIILNEFVSL